MNHLKDNIIIIPDSFKGSLTSKEVCEIIACELQKYTDRKCVEIPIADGGEGSVDCILSLISGKKEFVNVKSPENKLISAYYGLTLDKKAIIEIAESSGITKQTSFNALKASTYGFGQLILDALDKGAKTIYLCLGGSATTDGGCGMASALGVRFFDENNQEFIPVGESLVAIKSIDLDHLDNRIKNTNFIVISDVENPLYGSLGAAYIFAPQKGASKEDVKLLDEGLKHLSNILDKLKGTNYSSVKGAGAAGGVGYGCLIFLDAQIESGIETMLNISGFDQKIKDCSLIITGEGKLDKQSLMGKVLSGIKKHANEIPIISFCGTSDLSNKELEKMNIYAYEIAKGIPLEDAIKNAKKYLKLKVNECFKTHKW